MPGTLGELSIAFYYYRPAAVDADTTRRRSLDIPMILRVM